MEHIYFAVVFLFLFSVSVIALSQTLAGNSDNARELKADALNHPTYKNCKKLSAFLDQSLCQAKRSIKEQKMELEELIIE